MKRHYLIHLGIHKTATTATQHFFRKQEAKLMERNVRYVPLQIMRKEITPDFCSSSPLRRKKLFSRLNSFPEAKIILSDENMLGGIRKLSNRGLYPHAEKRVLSFCKAASDDLVTLFITLREPASLISSMYCEYLRHHDFVTFDHYIKGFDIADFSFARMFRWLNKVPGHTRIVITPFEDPPVGSLLATIARILREALGTHEMGDIGPFNQNRSRSSYTREELDMAACIANKSGGKAAREYLQKLDDESTRFGTTRFEPIEQPMADTINKRYREELAGTLARFR